MAGKKEKAFLGKWQGSNNDKLFPKPKKASKATTKSLKAAQAGAANSLANKIADKLTKGYKPLYDPASGYLGYPFNQKWVALSNFMVETVSYEAGEVLTIGAIAGLYYAGVLENVATLESEYTKTPTPEEVAKLAALMEQESALWAC